MKHAHTYAPYTPRHSTAEGAFVYMLCATIWASQQPPIVCFIYANAGNLLPAVHDFHDPASAGRNSIQYRFFYHWRVITQRETEGAKEGRKEGSRKAEEEVRAQGKEGRRTEGRLGGKKKYINKDSWKKEQQHRRKKRTLTLFLALGPNSKPPYVFMRPSGI